MKDLGTAFAYRPRSAQETPKGPDLCFRTTSHLFTRLVMGKWSGCD